MRAPVLLLLAALAPQGVAAAAAAGDRPAVVVTPGSAQTYRMALQRFGDADGPPTRATDFHDTLGAALEFSGVFDLLSPKAFLGPETTPTGTDAPPLVCSDWTQIGADALVEGWIRDDGPQLEVEFRVFDTTRCRRLLRKRYRQSRAADPDTLARRVADDVVGAFIGLRGVASTEIAFVSDRTGNPEIFVMNAMGADPRQATANRSINDFPDWSPDGNTILYTSYRYQSRPTLFLSARGRASPGRLLERIRSRISEYRGVFDPTGDRVAVVLSDGGPSELYTVGSDGQGLRRITNNRSIDVGPAWSPDGERMAFVSDRSGSPQIYVMDADGGEVRRLTYQGTYNTSPAWSPDGNWIAYESRVGGQFDIWLIDPSGQVNVPLITHPRSDEGPSFAPNSRKLVFSSNRRGRHDIYVVEVSGENLRRMTKGAGNNTNPSWGPFPQ